jgi:hypothetical protein
MIEFLFVAPHNFNELSRWFQLDFYQLPFLLARILIGIARTTP